MMALEIRLTYSPVCESEDVGILILLEGSCRRSRAVLARHWSQLIAIWRADGGSALRTNLRRRSILVRSFLVAQPLRVRRQASRATPADWPMPSSTAERVSHCISSNQRDPCALDLEFGRADEADSTATPLRAWARTLLQLLAS